MKRKLLAILLAVCLCVPLVFASCGDASISKISSVELYNDGVTYFDIASRSLLKLMGHEQLETEGSFTIVNDEFIVERVEREDEITVTPEEGDEYTYTEKFVDYNIYKTSDLSEVATYSYRSDSGYYGEEIEDDQVVEASVTYRTFGYTAAGSASFLVVSTRTYGGTYTTKIINDKNEALVSYTGEEQKSIQVNQSSPNYPLNVSAYFHFTLDDVLYRISDDGKPAVAVKDLSLTELDESISSNAPDMSYYKNGKYVFVYDEKAVIYNDKLEAPVFVDFPLEEKTVSQPHNEVSLSIDKVNVLENGNLYMLYKESKKLSCDKCDDGCSLFTEEKGNYQWLEGSTGYNYNAFVLDIQTGEFKEASAPSAYIMSIQANNDFIEAILGVKLYRDGVYNFVSGYEIVDQTKASEIKTYVMDNDGNITVEVDTPYDTEGIYPVDNGTYVAVIDEVTYILDKDLNIIREAMSGSVSTLKTTMIDKAIYNLLTGEKVFDIPKNYDLKGATSELYVFVANDEVETDEGTETRYDTVLIDEDGQTVKTIEMDENSTEIYMISDNYIIILEKVEIEDEILGTVYDYNEYTVYNCAGERIVSFQQDKNYSLYPMLYDDCLIIRYTAVKEDPEEATKSVALVIRQASESLGE